MSNQVPVVAGQIRAKLNIDTSMLSVGGQALRLQNDAASRIIRRAINSNSEVLPQKMQFLSGRKFYHETDSEEHEIFILTDEFNLLDENVLFLDGTFKGGVPIKSQKFLTFF